MKSNLKIVLLSLVTVLLIAAACYALLAVPALAQAVGAAVALPGGAGEPQPGTVQGIQTYLFYPAKATTGTTTFYAAPAAVDIMHSRNWHAVDVFVTGVVTPTKTMTVTAQLSADGNNWADAYHVEVLGSALLNVTHTPTDVVTHTLAITSSNTQALTKIPYRLVFAAGTATDYLRLPLAGEWLRFKVEHTGVVTPTIRVTYRND